MKVKFLLISIGVMLTLVSSARSEFVICPALGGLPGYDTERLLAKKFNPGKSTSDISKLRIFVTSKNDFVYMDANYVTPGNILADFLPLRTRLSTNESMDIRELTSNLVSSYFHTEEKLNALPKGVSFPEVFKDRLVYDSDANSLILRGMLSEEEVLILKSLSENESYKAAIDALLGKQIKHVDNFIEAYEKEIIFHVDQKFFLNQDNAEFAFGNAKNIKVIGSDGVLRDTQLLGTKRIVKFGTNLYYPVQRPDVPLLIKQIYKKPFDAKKAVVVPLTTDSGTIERFIRKIPAANRSNVKLTSKEELEKQLAKYRGRIVIPLGHFEKGSFVVIDAANKEVLKISSQELQVLAQKYNFKVIPFGCRSAEEFSNGIANVFNSLDAIDSLSKAIRSKTLGDFIENLSSSKVTFVMDDALLSDNTFSGSIDLVQRIENSLIDIPIIVGTLSLVETSIDNK